MSVNGAEAASRDKLNDQIARLAGSELLKGSDSLCRLLRYLAEHSFEHPGVSIKEYQIATEVFGRPADFDPRLDSTVRVQTGRLRSKLSEYYGAQGADDRLIIEVPKGAYSVTVHDRVFPAIVEPAKTPAAPMSSDSTPRSRAVVWALSFLCAGLAIALSYITLLRPAPAAAPPTINAPPALQAFWQGFIDRPDLPWVIFSNAEFIGRPDTGMRYFNPIKDAKDEILDHYTGVGEVIAIHELDRVFALLQHGLRVKRGRLLSMDDARNNDLIFVGSPSENLTLREIPTTREFVFRNLDKGPRKGDLAIVNLQPREGEQPAYMGTPKVPIYEDYALIAFVPGMSNPRNALILAGTTTIGTQAAVEYVCRPASVEELLQKSGRSNSGGIAPFEAVIRVKVSRGVPVSSEVVALHRRS